jgi:acyl dehydratase
MAVTWEDLEVGAQLEKGEVGPLTRTDIVRYAGASGDFNPNHHDELFAQASGFPSVFAHGMFTAGLLGTYLTGQLGAENVRRLQVQFREQVWPGDHLVFEATVIRKSEELGERTVDLDVTVTRTESGGAAVKGEATFVVP